MKLSIFAFGQPVLRQKAMDIAPDYPELGQLIEDMWETLYHADGVGLAAPQIGKSIRLFMVDTRQMEEKGKQVDQPIKKVFINAQVLEQWGDTWVYEEGCLSIPDVRGEVGRPAQLRIRYLDESFSEQEEVYTGITARVIQHEYDHIEGILFIEHLSPVKKTMIRARLENIRRGKVKAEYRMKFA